MCRGGVGEVRVRYYNDLPGRGGERNNNGRNKATAGPKREIIPTLNPYPCTRKKINQTTSIGIRLLNTFSDTQIFRTTAGVLRLCITK